LPATAISLVSAKRFCFLFLECGDSSPLCFAAEPPFFPLPVLRLEFLRLSFCARQLGSETTSALVVTPQVEKLAA
jgi:hypothetical protein